jgi:RNA polymerase sigma-70 factor (ECF subfamily)
VPNTDVLTDRAFKAQLEAVIPHLRAFAHSLRSQSVDADDLVQGALLNAWRSRDRFRAGTNFRSWMFTILRNIFYSALRRQKFERQAAEGEAEGLTAPPNQNGRIELAELRAAIDALSPCRREALLLVGAAGHSYEEAADICGCEIGTIKSRVSRARAELAEKLSDHPPTPRRKAPPRSGAPAAAPP